MGSESIVHEAEWAIDSEALRAIDSEAMKAKLPPFFTAKILQIWRALPVGYNI